MQNFQKLAPNSDSSAHKGTKKLPMRGAQFVESFQVLPINSLVPAFLLVIFKWSSTDFMDDPLFLDIWKKYKTCYLYDYIGEHVDAETAANLSTLFDIGGIVGGILAGLATDFTGKPATTCAVMLITAIPSVSPLISSQNPMKNVPFFHIPVVAVCLQCVWKLLPFECPRRQ